MMRSTLTYGAIAAAVLIGFTVISQMIIEPTPENFATAEVLGYAGMLLATSLIYFGVRRYRDAVAGGVISFGRALVVGLVTDLIASALFGLFMIYYFTTLWPEFLDQYLAHYQAQIRDSGRPAEEIAAQLARLDADAAFFTDPYIQSLVMFATVLVIGAVVSLVSALLLKRKPQPPHSAGT